MCPLTSYKAEFNPGRWCAGLEYYIKRKIEVEARRKRVVQLCASCNTSSSQSIERFFLH
ncbi:uncharacterized protein PHALS_02177 [Plasmopara halstedii]|uniref:Uncharacterized protein n=1 Tax=Plasmopara halstedii TaxID=4781 RepID=A0A0N7L3M2_PLAHL|nr:uncharacterized protein PHALS_02177 [Plasmopara halstedii]CEG36267.1 hypothetical protein PHALS_02177 [Plasmopara halstedii]|eukprot:XP_024572636.1 hypothetical protein PHALS_02177 [Plasmopara halstedii]